MNTYRKLQKRVNEVLHPEGVPLEFGVELKYYNYFKREDISTIYEANEHDDSFKRDCCDEKLIEAIDRASSYELCKRGIFTYKESDGEDWMDYLAKFRYTNIFMIKDGRIRSSAHTGVQEEIVDKHLYNNIIEVLGKPVSLQDILRIMGDNIQATTFDDTEVELEVYDNSGEYHLLHIDLTKDIKDQGEEVLEAIYQLIK